MNTLTKNLFAVGLALAASQLGTAPAAAQEVRGIGVANPTAIVALSKAYKTAEAQRATTYKAQFDQANSRKNQIEAQLRPLGAKFEADARAANPNQAALQQQYARIQQIEANGQQEINQILNPVAQSRAYVIEQIGDRLEAATRQAMAKQKVTLLLDSQAVVSAGQVYNLNQAILNELDALIPSAQLVPPAGWQPRAQREQAAAQGQDQAQPQPQPQSRSAPSGR